MQYVESETQLPHLLKHFSPVFTDFLLPVSFEGFDLFKQCNKKTPINHWSSTTTSDCSAARTSSTTSDLLRKFSFKVLKKSLKRLVDISAINLHNIHQVGYADEIADPFALRKEGTDSGFILHKKGIVNTKNLSIKRTSDLRSLERLDQTHPSCCRSTFRFPRKEIRTPSAESPRNSFFHSQKMFEQPD
jgi:hypothetical protein